jgi:uncharacterized membrane protein YbhN (UPF0104 family)
MLGSRWFTRWLSRRHIDRRTAELLGLFLAAVVLEVAAGVGLAYVAGFGAVRTALGHLDWSWVIVVFAALVVSFLGYYSAYWGIYRAEGGYEFSRRQLSAVVVAGFGGFFAHGGTAPDDLVLQSLGAARRDSLVRVWTLGGMEQGMLALGGCVASIAAVCLQLTAPPSDFTLPWVFVPIPAFIVAFWAAERYRTRLRDRSGWLGRLGMFLDSIHLIMKLFTHPLRHRRALTGMAVFWAADAFAVWAAIAAFGVRLDGAALIVGFCTGMVFTRRTAPLAGAGLLMLVLPVTICVSGAPLAVAISGIFAYRVLCLWLPMPFAFAFLPSLRKMSKAAVPGAGDPVLAAPGAGEAGLAAPGAGEAGLAAPGAGEAGLAVPEPDDPVLTAPEAGNAALRPPAERSGARKARSETAWVPLRARLWIPRRRLRNEDPA